LNGLTGLVRFYHGPGVRDRLANRPRRFDLVTANILARPLVRLAPALVKVLAPSGTMILSGLLARDAPGVLAAYAAQGLRLRSRLTIEGWTTLEMRGGGGAPRPAVAIELAAQPVRFGEGAGQSR
jgi:ribosomal protein L11 methyltransferase